MVAAADFDSSALAEHAWKRGHPVDWASVEVMSIAHNLRTRVIREAFSIRSSNVLNRDGGALPQEYESLIGISLIKQIGVDPPSVVTALCTSPSFFHSHFYIFWLFLVRM